MVYGFGVPIPEKLVNDVEPSIISSHIALNGEVLVGIDVGRDMFQS
jgi:hypothetical protein